MRTDRPYRIWKYHEDGRRRFVVALAGARDAEKKLAGLRAEETDPAWTYSLWVVDPLPGLRAERADRGRVAISDAAALPTHLSGVRIRTRKSAGFPEALF